MASSAANKRASARGRCHQEIAVVRIV